MPRSLERWTILDYEMPNSRYTLLALITGFATLTWSTAIDSTILGRPYIAWLSKFMQPEQNFFNHMVTLLWLNVSSPFAQQTFLVAYAVLLSSLNS